MPILEHATVAGCCALLLHGIDTELLPLLFEDAARNRPSIARLGVAVRCEDARETVLPMELSDTIVDSLDSAPPRPAHAEGGATRDVARRLDMDLDEFVSTLVERGLPFDDDLVTAETEETLRALLGISPPEELEPSTPKPMAIPAPALHPAVDVAGRILGKLLRKHVIGGKHTAADNVYGHHFADGEKDLARAVTEKLIRLGILFVKRSVGQRHVSVEPRKLEVARSLAESRCADPLVLEELTVA
jgi:hypothetical protein